MTQKDKQIEKLMKNLSLTKEEATDLYESDRKVDRMTSVKQVQSDMSEEHKAISKSMAKTSGTKKLEKAKATKKPTTYNFEKKPHKTDIEKAEFITYLYEFVVKFGKNVKIVKPEREISFDMGENNYSLTLTKHRKPKKS